MGYVALEHLVWGDGGIEPGDPVPEDEPGRDYGSMLRLGQIAETHSLGDLSDDEVRRELADARAELSKLRAAPASETEGPRLVLTDEQRELLTGQGLTGEFTLEELDAALTPVESEADISAEGLAAKAAAAEGAGSTPPADAGGDTGDGGDALPDGVTDLGGGWFLLADGETKIQGRKALDAALTPGE